MIFLNGTSFSDIKSKKMYSFFLFWLEWPWCFHFLTYFRGICTNIYWLQPARLLKAHGLSHLMHPGAWTWQYSPIWDPKAHPPPQCSDRGSTCWICLPEPHHRFSGVWVLISASPWEIIFLVLWSSLSLAALRSQWSALRKNVLLAVMGRQRFCLRLAPTQYPSCHLCTYNRLLTISAFSVTCWNENAWSLGPCSPFPYINLSHTRCGSSVFRKSDVTSHNTSIVIYSF